MRAPIERSTPARSSILRHVLIAGGEETKAGKEYTEGKDSSLYETSSGRGEKREHQPKSPVIQKGPRRKGKRAGPGLCSLCEESLHRLWGCRRRCLGPDKAFVKRDLAARLHEEDPTLGRGIASQSRRNTRLDRLASLVGIYGYLLFGSYIKAILEFAAKRRREGIAEGGKKIDSVWTLISDSW
ncbi:hypothetical protein Adt_21390 [Abeliophyllum distichum]|uniref:Uncharacterized protein n=1 Tax=Abeliophyllum distichum TaxID=126358 RepID=A0ABD1QW33_9LAMI